jgi:hypothetical protein
VAERVDVVSALSRSYLFEDLTADDPLVDRLILRLLELADTSPDPGAGTRARLPADATGAPISRIPDSPSAATSHLRRDPTTQRGAQDRRTMALTVTSPQE